MEKKYLKDLEKANWAKVEECDKHLYGMVFHTVHMYADNIHILKWTGNCRKCGKQITNICVEKSETKTMYYHVLDDGSLLPFDDFAMDGITDELAYMCHCDECHASTVASDFGKKFTVCELEGSERQVAWAEKIRFEKMWLYHCHHRDSIRFARRDETDKVANRLNEWHEILEWVINKHTKASWWIDNRSNGIKTIISENKDAWKEYMSVSPEEREEAEKIEMDAKAEATVIPKDRTHDGVAYVIVTDKSVTVEYPKDETFRTLVKNLGYGWDGACWYKEITVTTGPSQERAAELGNKLLTNGFAMCIMDEEIRKRAVEADYEPEYRRWVLVRKDCPGLFLLKWERGNDRIYRDSRKIRGSKYDRPYVTVPFTEYNSVLDFANEYGFKFTDGAQFVVNNMQGKVVEPAKEKETVYDEHPASEILNSSREVLEDLKDD